MPRGELDDHPGYEKHAHKGRNSGNSSRNGFSSKKVKSEILGDMVLSIPHDRNSQRQEYQ
jgi:putative transposase